MMWKNRSSTGKLTRKSAMSVALGCLSRRQMTVAQLMKRLAEKEFTDEEIGQTVKKLQSWKYLDDRGYTLAYIRTKREKYSKKRTMVELERAGIEKDQAIVLLEQSYSDVQEQQNCSQLATKLWGDESIKWERKVKTLASYQKCPREILLKKKVADKLLSRGFPWDTVKNVLEKILAEDNQG